jgi:hypothetical protein
MKSAIYKDKDGNAVAEMQVGEVLDWTYEPPLDEGDTIGDWDISVTGDGLSKGSDGQQGSMIYVFVDATQVSVDAKIRYTVETTGGRTFVDDLYMKITA